MSREYREESLRRREMATVPVWAGQPCHAKTSPVSLFGHDVSFETHAANAMNRAVARACVKAAKRASLVHSIGTCNCRQTTGGHSWSAHAWCGAVDIDPERNPYSSSGRLITDFTPEFIDCFKHEGFGWGGDWHSVKDAMHFTIATNEGGHIIAEAYDPALYRKAIDAWHSLTGSKKPTPPPPPKQPGTAAPDWHRDWDRFVLERPPMRAPQIQTWKRQMIVRGWTMDDNDVYGGQSRAACMAFQREKLLGVDGVVGPVTWNAAWERPVT